MYFNHSRKLLMHLYMQIFVELSTWKDSSRCLLVVARDIREVKECLVICVLHLLALVILKSWPTMQRLVSCIPANFHSLQGRRCYHLLFKMLSQYYVQGGPKEKATSELSSECIKTC